MKKTIYIFSNGELKRKQNTLFVDIKDERKRYLPVENISEIMIFGEVEIEGEITKAKFEKLKYELAGRALALHPDFFCGKIPLVSRWG